MRTHRPPRVPLAATTALVAGALAAGAAPAQEPTFPTIAEVETLSTDAGPIAVERIAEGLVHPWGMAFLPDGRLLVTERPGRLRILATDGTLSEPIEGVPEVFAQGQGGLLDVALDPDFAENDLVWLSFADPAAGGAATALGRGRLVEGRIAGFETIFRQEPATSGENHFGSRIVFTPDGHVFLAMAERFEFEPAQDLSNTLGTIVRLNRDGSIPQDNPFVGDPNAEDAIWSYGHRNIQAAALHPDTGELWVAEMGPMGGDELNQPEAGRNYGWPVVSWGRHYDGRDIPDPPTHPDFADAALQWTPVIAPAGMIFYTGDLYEAWRGDALIGGLVSQGLVRVDFEDGEAREEAERIPLGTRVRDVVQGPDGRVFVLSDQQDGAVLRLSPVE
ncbi:PQQ-dependent sugar dehydrogenase [Salinarimonas rosea]|uniref:PQQ-dependent sugar dehydrogenase n=1 Tax=Salinarimonas rosea TaxID=552063 RepID=UPI000423555E|nr:PQQ-dependent sugar dehydrogenase [Salinarimonas rosea]